MKDHNDRLRAHAPFVGHVPAELLAELNALLAERRESLSRRLDLLAQELPSEGPDGLRGLGDAELVRAQYEATRASLLEVDAAIERIDAGTYGHCVDCAQPINLERLEALPDAAVCLACTAP